MQLSCTSLVPASLHAVPEHLSHAVCGHHLHVDSSVPLCAAFLHVYANHSQIQVALERLSHIVCSLCDATYTASPHLGGVTPQSPPTSLSHSPQSMASVSYTHLTLPTMPDV